MDIRTEIPCWIADRREAVLQGGVLCKKKGVCVGGPIYTNNCRTFGVDRKETSCIQRSSKELWRNEVVLTSHQLCSIRSVVYLNLLKANYYVMHQQFNIQQLYVLPTLYLCVLYLTENKQRLFPYTALTDRFI